MSVDGSFNSVRSQSVSYIQIFADCPKHLSPNALVQVSVASVATAIAFDSSWDKTPLDKGCVIANLVRFCLHYRQRDHMQRCFSLKLNDVCCLKPGCFRRRGTRIKFQGDVFLLPEAAHLVVLSTKIRSRASTVSTQADHQRRLQGSFQKCLEPI